jgi:Ran GTPase-activating protein (RanGAP) involved in mRNA processing and transport
MKDARRKEIQRAVTLIEEAKDILEVAQTQEQDDFDNMSEDLQDGDEGLRAEEAFDALERAVTCCDDAISACADALQS